MKLITKYECLRLNKKIIPTFQDRTYNYSSFVVVFISTLQQRFVFGPSDSKCINVGPAFGNCSERFSVAMLSRLQQPSPQVKVVGALWFLRNLLAEPYENPLSNSHWELVTNVPILWNTDSCHVFKQRLGAYYIPRLPLSLSITHSTAIK